MDRTVFVLTGLAALFWIPAAIEMFFGFLKIRFLRQFEPLSSDRCPLLSIIVPARNEEKTIEPAMRSLLALDYPNLEIIGVNDRSEDQTGAILDRLATGSRALRVVHIRELPGGWLGKNHALAKGAEAAQGEWILFTDADVVFQPDALRRALNAALHYSTDHLVALPDVPMESFMERIFIPFFITMFNFRFRPWQVFWKWGFGYVGVGAFNLVRAEAYRSFGGHGALRMDVADDIKLGKLFRKHRLRQAVVMAEELVHVRWVVGVKGAAESLDKNAFAGLDYSWPSTLLISAILLIALVWPYVGLAIGPSDIRWWSIATLAAMLLAAQAQVGYTRLSAFYALAWPISMLVFLAILLRSAVRATLNRGIYWRGTFYPLGELKRNLV